ncbi:hypothetical protein [uncultured Methanobrevibacter sp.]|uniref:hypothetical protein n=1 Tax=uncultured Methanobrevibacter sp. TaxID=253161 RepID=UPI0025FE1CBB|nr:hypothetical protein [uncultured Methanobrevibacter sp.]
MVYKSHYIEIYVNGNLLELESQDSLNLRFQNTIYDPEKISSTQAEYSFEFEIPSTPNNDKIFNYANNLSKLNKFRARFNAEVYGDGTLIFQGTLTLNGFKSKKYKCNLVSVKTYSLEEIFGDTVLSDIDWSVPFEGAGNYQYTINYYNSVPQEMVKFPLVSYGAFQKTPYNSDDVASDYTSKYDIDKYNRWYVESFAPSLNMLEYIKKSFNYKGYSVGGDVFNNPNLNSIFMSTNLADGQTPDYNIGNPKFGSVKLSTSFSTVSKSGYAQELQFPYYKISAKQSTTTFDIAEEYNFKDIMIYDMLEKGNVTLSASTYMYQPDEHIIVIPADGFYKIEMDVTSNLNTTSNITAAQYTRYSQAEEELNEEDLQLAPGLFEITPLEIHLVRNYGDNIELIKGKNNTSYVDGNPNDSIAWDSYPNQQNWQTCFPHEDLYGAELPTKENDLRYRNTSERIGGLRTESTETTSGRIGGQRSRAFEREGSRRWSYAEYGYIYNDNEIMAYDQAVSEAFICGFSSMKGGTVAVMKNGYSWSKSNAKKNESFYPEIGYSKLYREEGSSSILTEQTRFNENTYINTPVSRINATERNMTGYLSCMVYLKKNDILQLYAVHRGYHTTNGGLVRYETTSQVNLSISAFSPRHYDILKADKANRYDATVEFPVNLKVTNFLNNEKKVSEWMQNVIDAFNFEFVQNGNRVEINSKKKFEPLGIGVVDLDNRVNTSEAESSIIEYPKSMSVRYKIDTDEHGFYITVPTEYINDDDWKDYGDSGFTTVYLNDDSYVTEESNKNTQFSYTWYDNFKWFPVDSNFNQQEGVEPTILRIPVISKEEYMIDGYDYTESMKHDGYGLTQRFWFAPKYTNCYVYTRTYPSEIVNIYIPTNEYQGLNLSYKDTEKSLLSEYFNLTPYLSSNYVIVEAYISANEYKMIKNGAAIHFDSDIYIPVEISGFDPSGENTTEIKMIKKV